MVDAVVKEIYCIQETVRTLIEKLPENNVKVEIKSFSK
jgi:hypothetical protein